MGHWARRALLTCTRNVSSFPRSTQKIVGMRWDGMGRPWKIEAQITFSWIVWVVVEWRRQQQAASKQSRRGFFRLEMSFLRSIIGMNPEFKAPDENSLCFTATFAMEWACKAEILEPLPISCCFYYSYALLWWRRSISWFFFRVRGRRTDCDYDDDSRQLEEKQNRRMNFFF